MFLWCVMPHPTHPRKKLRALLDGNGLAMPTSFHVNHFADRSDFPFLLLFRTSILSADTKLSFRGVYPTIRHVKTVEVRKLWLPLVIPKRDCLGCSQNHPHLKLANRNSDLFSIFRRTRASSPSCKAPISADIFSMYLASQYIGFVVRGEWHNRPVVQPDDADRKEPFVRFPFHRWPLVETPEPVPDFHIFNLNKFVAFSPKKRALRKAVAHSTAVRYDLFNHTLRILYLLDAKCVVAVTGLLCSKISDRKNLAEVVLGLQLPDNVVLQRTDHRAALSAIT